MRKLIILALIFIAAIGIFILTTREEEKKTSYTVMSGASLPVLELCYEDWIINELYGYTVKMDGASMRETLYPLGEDCMLPLRIRTKGAEVESVSYEVRSMETLRLIENNSTEEIVREEQNLYTSRIKLMDLLNRDEEYLITFTLTMADQTEVYYYTKVNFAGSETIRGAIEFACDFSEKTFWDEPDDMLIAQLESNASADISNLGYTDIYSSHSHVLWGNLNPKKVGETKITIHEIGRLVTSLVMEYEIEAQDEDEKKERYHVREFYCVRYVNGKYYLMTYERLAEQSHVPGEEVITEDGSLELGVISGAELPLQIEHQGDYTAFVLDGNLWCYDADTDVLGTLFTFNTDWQGYSSRRHDLRIVRMEENGDVEFVVYGYMGGGSHEGETGICFYRYLAEKDALEEVFYVSSDHSGEQVRQEVGKLSYMSDNGLFYLLYGETVYAIDLDGGEYVELVSHLSADELVIDEKNGIVAWQEQKENGNSEIIIYYLNQGESRVLTAPEGEQYRLFGFIREDLLYGVIRETDRQLTQVYSSEAPVYALEIVNTQGERKSRYEQNDVYLDDVEILADRVCFGRKTVENGVWKRLSDDTLFSSVSNEVIGDSVLESSVSDRQKRIYRLALSMTEKTIIRNNCPKLLDKECLWLNLGVNDEGEEHYYAYSFGKLQGIFDELSEAIKCVDKPLGVVINDSHQIVWNRGNRGNRVLISMAQKEPIAAPGLADYLELYLRKLGVETDCDAEVFSGENALHILKNHSDKSFLNLEGCTLSQILYYLDGGRAVLGFADNNQPVLLVGYEELYGEITLYVYSPKTAQEEEYDFDEVEGWFETSGNRFISVLP